MQLSGRGDPVAHGDGSERIRDAAWTRIIVPQIDEGKKRIQVAVRPLMRMLEAEGFPKNRPRQFCKALQKQSFLEEKGLSLDHVDGPDSGTSTTVVLLSRLRVERGTKHRRSGRIDLHRRFAG